MTCMRSVPFGLPKNCGSRGLKCALGETFIENSAHQGAETQTWADGRSAPMPQGATRLGLLRSGRL